MATTIRTPKAIDLKPQRVQVGDTVAFVDKINATQQKLEVWTENELQNFSADVAVVANELETARDQSVTAKTAAETAKAAADSSKSAAATSATNAAASATAANNSATSASNSATAATTAKTAAETAKAAADSSKNAAATSATNAATSATNAAASATAANNSATSASSSATAATAAKTAAETAKAAADSSKSAASSSASAASASATSASNSATAANSSKTAASSSATAASASATSAASSATSANSSKDAAASSATAAAGSAAAAIAAKNQAEGIIASVTDQAGLVAAVEAYSGGSVTVRFTAKGQPCYFYKQPVFNIEDAVPDGSAGTGRHTAFVRPSGPVKYILVGMYQAAEVDGEYVSQPNRVPATGKTHDQELAMAAATGPGFRLMSNWDWSALVLGTNLLSNPGGNTNYGRSHSDRKVSGIRADNKLPGDTSSGGVALTGSGGGFWQLNPLMKTGPYDMVGNVWERVTGLKLIDNKIYYTQQNGGSTYVEYDVGVPGNGDFSSLLYPPSATKIREMLVGPIAGMNLDGYFWKNPVGERIPLRGGGWYNAGLAGLAALNLDHERSAAHSNIGVRLAFWDQ